MLKGCRNLLVATTKFDMRQWTVATVYTVPDRVLEEARHSRLGRTVRGPSVEERKERTTVSATQQTRESIQTSHDYKYTKL